MDLDRLWTHSDLKGFSPFQLLRNSKGVIWKSEKGTKGNFKNFEQKEVAAIGPHLSLLSASLALVVLCFD